MALRLFFPTASICCCWFFSLLNESLSLFSHLFFYSNIGQIKQPVTDSTNCRKLIYSSDCPTLVDIYKKLTAQETCFCSCDINMQQMGSTAWLLGICGKMMARKLFTFRVIALYSGPFSLLSYCRLRTNYNITDDLVDPAACKV